MAEKFRLCLKWSGASCLWDATPESGLTLNGKLSFIQQ